MLRTWVAERGSNSNAPCPSFHFATVHIATGTLPEKKKVKTKSGSQVRLGSPARMMLITSCKMQPASRRKKLAASGELLLLLPCYATTHHSSLFVSPTTRNQPTIHCTGGCHARAHSMNRPTAAAMTKLRSLLAAALSVCVSPAVRPSCTNIHARINQPARLLYLPCPQTIGVAVPSIHRHSNQIRPNCTAPRAATRQPGSDRSARPNRPPCSQQPSNKDKQTSTRSAWLCEPCRFFCGSSLKAAREQETIYLTRGPRASPPTWALPRGASCGR
ncbi:hypothetical protein BKA80DRAFT_73208 [Phyllosticta citrichinensis]